MKNAFKWNIHTFLFYYEFIINIGKILYLSKNNVIIRTLHTTDAVEIY